MVTIVHPAVKNVPEDMAQLGALATANGTPTETHAQVKTMMISFSNYSFRIIYPFFNEDMHVIHISCIASGGVNPVPCSNKQSDYNCDWWKGKGFCTNSHDAYMKKYCKKACNQCQ